MIFTLSLIIILISFISTGVFLYSNFYKIILQTEEIIILQTSALLDPVKIDLMHEVLEKLATKNQGGTLELAEIKNPFQSE